MSFSDETYSADDFEESLNDSVSANDEITDKDYTAFLSFQSNNSPDGIVLAEDVANAILRGNLQTVKLLILDSFNVNAVLKCGWTALMYSARYVQPDIMKLLLDNGANVHYKDNFVTPLSLLCMQKPSFYEDSVRCAKLLLDHGADSKVQDSNRFTCLSLATRANNELLVELLLLHPCDILQIDGEGYSALHWAASNGNYNLCSLLLKGGSQIDLLSSYGQTAADVALEKGYPVLSDQLNSGKLNALGCEKRAEVGTTDEITFTENLDDLSLFLTGLNLGEFTPLFESQSITFADLLTLSDTELEKLGIKQMGHRKKILNGVFEVHRRKWSNDSIPHGREFNRNLTCTDIQGILATNQTHIKYLISCIIYMRRQIQSSPEFITGTVRPDSSINQLCSIIKDSNDDISLLRSQIEKLNSVLLPLSKSEPLDVVPSSSYNSWKYPSIIIVGMGAVTLLTGLFLKSRTKKS